MIDAEDRALLIVWGLRIAAGAAGIFAVAVTAGLAWRVFELLATP